ncbi:MAG: AAA family ATPase [Clostridia bacterium]|nr:AAA family ATPase [Clostridia bacterium]
MAKVILIASGKGGVGKSTTAVGLAYALGRLEKKVLIIDLDTGLGCDDILCFRSDSSVFNWGDVVTGSVECSKALIDCSGGVKLLSAPQKIPEGFSYDTLASFIRGLAAAFDFVLLDAPAGLGTMVQTAAASSDYAILVATPDPVSVKAACTLVGDCERLGIGESRLVINRFIYKEVRHGRQMNIDAVIDSATARLIGIIPEDDMLRCGIVTGSRLGVKSKARQAFNRIAARVCGFSVEIRLSQLK